MADKRVFALVWRIVGLILGCAGIVLQLTSTGGFMGASMLTFFTIQTNIFSTILFAALAILTAIQIVKLGKKGKVAHVNPNFQLALTFYITITFVVYWTMLSWQKYEGGEGAISFLVSNYLLHGIVPLFAMIDALLFMPHGEIKKIQAVWWLVYPLLYLVFVVIRANVGGPLYSMVIGGVTIELFYPYFFIEPSILGSAWYILPIAICFSALFWAFAKLFIFVDRRIAVYIAKKHSEEYRYIEKV